MVKLIYRLSCSYSSSNPLYHDAQKLVALGLMTSTLLLTFMACKKTPNEVVSESLAQIQNAPAAGITDSCENFSNKMIYDKMSVNTNTITELIDALDDNLPTGTTQARYDLLRQFYGY